MNFFIFLRKKSNLNLFRAASKFQRPEIISPNLLDGFEEILKNKNPTNKQFKELRENLIKNYRNLNEINVDTTILGNFKNSDELPIAKSYLKFLKSEDRNINTAFLGKLLKLYYLSFKSGHPTDSVEILTICKDIQEKSPVQDATTCENLIYGLLATDEWCNSLDLIKMIKLTCTPSAAVLSAVASKAFQQNNKIIGWKVLDELVQLRRQPKCEIFIEYLDLISKDPNNFIENLEKILNFIGRNELVVPKLVTQHLQTKLQEVMNIKGILSSINKKGFCSQCETFMERIQITNLEFNQLKNEFLDRVLIRKDVFLKATPAEITYFQEFIEKHGPFHCVIDGLNVAYSCGSKKNNNLYAKLLYLVVKYFAEKKKNILVIGRKHMNRWPKDQMNYIKFNSKLFLANDLSHDDPFLLYAALRSGPATDFFSRDLMRSHFHLLGPDLKLIFKKWQLEHQYSLVTAKNDKIVIKEPIKYNINAHKINNTWHIPFREEYTATPEQIFEAPENWLCISLNK